MLARIFPKQFDNTYRGYWLGLVLLALIVAVKALQGIESMIWTHKTMIGADGIPVDTFGPVAAGEATLMFALLGMYLLLIPLQSVVVLIRYRSMVPLMLLLLLVVQLGARIVHLLHPTIRDNATSGHPIGFYVNLGILAVTLIAFVLSVMRPLKPASIAQGARS